ncbi:MAG: tRNA1(Val) (adenine(37)-N6)-methyltransferase [Mucilaginibacter sp.]
MSVFKFKQFSVDQAGCAMKINTDGVLLGAMAAADRPQKILDIGTGTGVIALMLAQRFNDARVDAVEIDQSAAETAKRNFENSSFARRLHIHPSGINEYFEQHSGEKFDLIVSNPPFYINSLKSPQEKKKQAKHTDVDFFERLMKDVSAHLSPDGLCWLVLPVETAAEVKLLAAQNGMQVQKQVNIRSFSDSEPHREIVCLGFGNKPVETSEFVIYQSVGVYSEEYKELLKPYFLAF